MICHSMGRPPTSTSGFGFTTVSSDKRVPSPPARIATFINFLSVINGLIIHVQWKIQSYKIVMKRALPTWAGLFSFVQRVTGSGPVYFFLVVVFLAAFGAALGAS